MSKIINFEVWRFPAARLIGKQVRMDINSGPDNPAVAMWRSMWQDGSMELLNSLPCLLTKDPDTVGWRGDFNSQDNTFTYIAGVLAKEGAEVPEGFVFRDLAECEMGIGWIQGREEGADLYAEAHDKFSLAMREKGYEYDYAAGAYEMEYYSYKRFGVPRYIGNKLLILDYYAPCKKLRAEGGKNEDEEALVVSEEDKMRKTFDSLAQRMVYRYKCTFPDCIPVEEDNASQEAQRQMSGFLHDVICSIYEDPSLIDFKTEKDDFIENWEMMNSRPELVKVMRKMEKVLLEFYTFLYTIGENGELQDNKLYVSNNKMKLAKKRLMQLVRLGLSNESKGDGTVFYCEKYPKLFPAWKLLCNNSHDSMKNGMSSFIYCMYAVSNYKAEHLFGKITGNSVLIRELEDHFIKMGYHCSFDEYGIHWEKEYTDNQKGKANFFFDWKRRDQMAYIFHVPSFRQELASFDKMDNELKDMTFSRTKKCDGCGYCTQLDKTGKRKPLALTLEYNGQKAEKCPLFPNLTWRLIDEREVNAIIRLFDFSNSFI